MKLGNFEVLEIDTGRFMLDGGAMFGVVPKALWERSDKADSKNRIELALRTLLIKSKDFNLLIDVGMGSKWNQRQREIFNLREKPMEALLKEQAGLACSDISHVLITHLHFDHCGGLTELNGDGNPTQTFKKAEVYVHEDNLKWAENPNLREKASYLNENWQAYKDSKQLQLVRSKPMEKKEILPGVWIMRSDGHTRGQQCVLLDGGKDGKLFFCGDLIPSSSHIKIPWTMGYDIDPLTIMNEKRIVLNEASRENWRLYFEHDARGAMASLVKESEDKFRLLNTPADF